MVHPIVEDSNDDAERLMARVCAGDDAAFASIFDRYHRLVYTTAMRVTNRADAAEDVTHLVFLNIWSAPEAYRGGSLSAWLVRVTRIASSDESRRNVALGTSNVLAAS